MVSTLWSLMRPESGEKVNKEDVSQEVGWGLHRGCLGFGNTARAIVHAVHHSHDAVAVWACRILPVGLSLDDCD
jgi:hypothetical protein